jgi:hypothetical protein
MLAVSQQISSVAHIVNVLSRDLFELKKQVANAGVNEASSTSNSVVQNSGPSHDEMQRAISTSVSDCHARITEVKRVVDAVKTDISKEIVLLETSLSRKIEGNVNKMLNDKIAVALDSYKNSIKDLVLTELQTSNANGSDANSSPPPEQDDFEINVTLASVDTATSPATTTTTTTTTAGSKRGGRKASASKAAAASVGKDA